MNLWVIFLTGLTTGGLSCLAVQGGLLATAITGQSHTGRQKKLHDEVLKMQVAANPWPVVYFLAAKLLAYTALGFLLGAVGSALQISPKTEAVMQLVAAFYMLVTALNLLEVHPIFRYFVLQPPSFLTRRVRNQARQQSLYTPVILGAMTVLIPCGTTQAMMVLAISEGHALVGAAILAVFVLGTSPTFFVLGFLATQLQHRLKLAFNYAAATLIILVGLLSADNALKVLNSPFVPSYTANSALESLGIVKPEPVYAQDVDGVEEMTIHVEEEAYKPNHWIAKQGKPLRIRLITKDTYGCTLVFTIPEYNVVQFLDTTDEQVVELPPQLPGEINFMCSMGMYTGKIEVQ
ncbi:MAG: sulfite exporter TauE/SafE family protein [Chloroflexi bacterium]|nr:sulfite exporter TauE/SafE family protein [Chloroflexota bacterium]